MKYLLTMVCGLMLLGAQAQYSADGYDQMPDAPTLQEFSTKTTPSNLSMIKGGDGDYSNRFQKKKKSPFLAAAFDFFLPGLGNIYRGHKVWSGVGTAIGFSGLTYVELQLKDENPDLFLASFGSVFVINTAIAIRTYKSTQYHNNRIGE